MQLWRILEFHDKLIHLLIIMPWQTLWLAGQRDRGAIRQGRKEEDRLPASGTLPKDWSALWTGVLAPPRRTQSHLWSVFSCRPCAVGRPPPSTSLPLPSQWGSWCLGRRCRVSFPAAARPVCMQKHCQSNEKEEQVGMTGVFKHLIYVSLCLLCM